MRLVALLVGLALAACSGGSPPDPVPAPTIASPLSYLAQSAYPDGSPATPLYPSNAWRYVRKDWGGYQVEQSFLRGDGVGAETIWSYPPFGSFVAANGDGGEVYRVGGDGSLYISETQDGDRSGITQFGTGWWMFDQYVPDCAAGWRGSPDGLGRACHQVITFPATGVPGNVITADTIVSEHYNLPLQLGPLERAFYSLGWGRLAWMSFGQLSCQQVDQVRAPPISAFDAGPGLKCDERLNTNIVPVSGGMSGQMFGWP